MQMHIKKKISHSKEANFQESMKKRLEENLNNAIRASLRPAEDCTQDYSMPAINKIKENKLLRELKKTAAEPYKHINKKNISSEFMSLKSILTTIIIPTLSTIAPNQGLLIRIILAPFTEAIKNLSKKVKQAHLEKQLQIATLPQRNKELRKAISDLKLLINLKKISTKLITPCIGTLDKELELEISSLLTIEEENFSFLTETFIDDTTDTAYLDFIDSLEKEKNNLGRDLFNEYLFDTYNLVTKNLHPYIKMMIIKKLDNMLDKKIVESLSQNIKKITNLFYEEAYKDTNKNIATTIGELLTKAPNFDQKEINPMKETLKRIYVDVNNPVLRSFEKVLTEAENLNLGYTNGNSKHLFTSTKNLIDQLTELNLLPQDQIKHIKNHLIKTAKNKIIQSTKETLIKLSGSFPTFDPESIKELKEIIDQIIEY